MAGVALLICFSFPLKIIQKFLVKLFSKSFRKRCFFENRRHPRTFIFYQQVPSRTAHTPPAAGDRAGTG
ncbi:hypothetical protein CFR76_14655 [Komagataeibacter swingsii]|uniref:Uncharacterized protein n=1 Tax=Komagataeibacter swingsii TaxID=215220 RepID=A0A2V4QYG9_9PROT|nr:hypothetical protein CFR76_14655 [Komagataeibacter swingsii]